ncbi:YjbF family lipoprotein [Salmonella enterica]|nr:YjbF family lipoprotein [Salmonella enterica]
MVILPLWRSVVKRLALILICLLLQACSATTKGLGDSLWDSLFGTPGVQLTDDDIQNMPYASQYMQLNGGPQLFVVLAFSENGQQKWVTQDGATWTRTLGWTEHRQVRYATARSVFTWRGTDSVNVGSEETAVRVLDEEVTTDQTRWRNRYWVDSEGQIRQTEQYLGANYFPVKTTLIKAAKS